MIRHLRWINVLSLDATAVAVIWQFVLTRIHRGDTPTWGESVSMGLVVWLVYTADRWLDAVVGRRRHRPMHRHAFAGRHPIAIAAVWLAVALLFIVVATQSLAPEVWFRCLPAAVIVAVYLIVRAVWHRPASVWIKSAFVAVTFSYGMHILSIAALSESAGRTGLSTGPIVVGSILLLAALIYHNCVAVNRLKHRRIRSALAVERYADVIARLAWLTIAVAFLLWGVQFSGSLRLLMSCVTGGIAMSFLDRLIRRQPVGQNAWQRSLLSSGYDLCLILATVWMW